jgi:hypothetical protein
MAYIFYRARSFPEQGIKNLLHHLQPIGTKVVRTDREVSFVKQLVDDLQNDIALSHEAMARVFMSTNLGQEWIADVQSKRYVGVPLLCLRVCSSLCFTFSAMQVLTPCQQVCAAWYSVVKRS